jgi:hypothetical protein
MHDMKYVILLLFTSQLLMLQLPQAAPGQPADVRISLTGQGHWSYLGTDILHVPESQVMPEGLRGPSKVQRIKCAVGPVTLSTQHLTGGCHRLVSRARHSAMCVA